MIGFHDWINAWQHLILCILKVANYFKGVHFGSSILNSIIFGISFGTAFKDSLPSTKEKLSLFSLLHLDFWPRKVLLQSVHPFYLKHIALNDICLFPKYLTHLQKLDTWQEIGKRMCHELWKLRITERLECSRHHWTLDKHIQQTQVIMTFIIPTVFILKENSNKLKLRAMVKTL